MNFRILSPALICVQVVFAVHVLNANAQAEFVPPKTHDTKELLEFVTVVTEEQEQEEEPQTDPAIECSLNAFVYELDNILCLSTEQHQAIVDGLRAAWNKKRYRRPFNFNITGAEVIKEELALLREFSGDVLDEQQSQLLEKIEKFPIGYEGFLAVREAEKNDEGELFKQFGMEVTDQKIAELTRICELADEQVAKLKVARNGVLIALSEERIEIMESIAEPDKIVFDKRAMHMIAKPLIFRCAESPIWQAALKETLTEEQLAKIAERDALRTAIVKRYASNQAIDHLILRLLKIDMSAEKLAEVEAVFIEHIQHRYICDIWRKNGLEEIPKAKLIELVGEEHGEKLHQAIAKEASIYDSK